MPIRFSSNLTRRKLLFDAAALIALGLAAPEAVVAESIVPCWRKRALSEISFQSLARQTNTRFAVRAAAGPAITVSLTETAMREAASGPEHESFSLIFSGARGEMLGQETYEFEHWLLGRFDLFIVPVLTASRSRIDYEAVVHRPRSGFLPAHT
ncbi:MAG TPA: hypothetical protein VGO59_07050 [Verrucomicrobiae bacterium]|jgi:hypothetical protein